MTATDNIDCVFFFTFYVLFKLVILMTPKKKQKNTQPFLFFIPFCLLFGVCFGLFLFSFGPFLFIHKITDNIHWLFLFSYCLTVFLNKRKNLAEFAGILLKKCCFFYIRNIFSDSDLFFKLYFQNRMIDKINLKKNLI